MSRPRILLLGTGDLPSGALEVVDFPRLRLWHFARAILQAGAELWLVAGVELPGSSPLRDTLSPSWISTELEGIPLKLKRVPKAEFDLQEAPLRWLRESQATAVVSAGPFAPARAASRIPRGLPVWIDLPGDMMAEAQLRSQTSGDKAHLLHAWEVLQAALRRGDVFSAISERQRCAVLGQLGLAGRLVPEVQGEALVHTLPVAVEPLWQRWAGAALRSPQSELRDPNHLILPGAINTWMDLETLAEGIRRALLRSPALKMTVTGGPIAGHFDEGHSRLLALARASGLEERWRFTGWIPAEEAAHLTARASWGLSLDRPGLEPFLGSRTRLLYGLALGLRFLLTPGSTLAEALVAEGLALPVPHGEPERLAQSILEAVSMPYTAEQQDARARLLARTDADVVSAPLLAWCRHPRISPPGADLDEGLRLRLSNLEEELEAIHQSPTWRGLSKLHQGIRRLRRG